LKRNAKKFVIKVSYMSPRDMSASPTFRKKAVNVRVPFQVTPKGMKNADKARRKELGFVEIVKKAKNNASYGRKKTV
jgi:hypothetical protein